MENGSYDIGNKRKRLEMKRLDEIREFIGENKRKNFRQKFLSQVIESSQVLPNDNFFPSDNYYARLTPKLKLTQKLRPTVFYCLEIRQKFGRKKGSS